MMRCLELGFFQIVNVKALSLLPVGSVKDITLFQVGFVGEELAQTEISLQSCECINH